MAIWSQSAPPPLGGLDRSTRAAILDLQRRVAELEENGGGGGGGGSGVAEFSLTIEIDTPVAGTHHLWVSNFDCDVERVRAYREDGTGLTCNVLNAGSYVMSTDLSVAVADSWTSAAADQNAAVTSGGVITVEVVSITGTPSKLLVQVDFSS